MVISIVSVVYKNQEPSLVWGTTLEGPSLHHSVAWRQASRVTSRMFFLTSSWRTCERNRWKMMCWRKCWHHFPTEMSSWKKPLENDVNISVLDLVHRRFFSIVRRDFTSIWPPKNWHIFHWKLIFQSPTHGRDHVGGNTYTLMSKVGVELRVLL